MDSDATPNAAQPKSRRRWYQFTLRTLLIFVTLAGCGAIRVIAVAVGCLSIAISGCGSSSHNRENVPSQPTAAVTDEQSPTVYWLAIGPLHDDEGQLNDDTDIPMGGGRLGGMVTVFVNGSPHDMIASGVGLEITLQVESGRNTIEIKGDHDQRLFAKVFTFRGDPLNPKIPVKDRKCLAKRAIEATSSSSQLTFETTVNFSPPFELIAAKYPSADRLQETLRAKLQQYADALNNHSADEAERAIPYPTALPWLSAADQVKKRQAANEAQQRLAKFVANPDFKLVSTAADIRFVIGKRAVLAYAGTVKDEFGGYEAYLFKARIGTQEGKGEPMVLVLQDGNWVRL